MKQNRKNEESYQKKVEKVLLDEEVRKFQNEQKRIVSMMKRGITESDERSERNNCCGEFGEEHYSTCSNCNKLLPVSALSKFISKTFP